jgi:hypothetical protein
MNPSSGEMANFEGTSIQRTKTSRPTYLNSKPNSWQLTAAVEEAMRDLTPVIRWGTTKKRKKNP